MTLPDTFHAKTRPSDCIVWTGALNSRGYGCFAIQGKSHLAHRVAYEDAHGPIPDGMTIDHLCSQKRCVNPDHLEVVTRGENNRRGHSLEVGMFCQGGAHLIETEGDLYVNPTGRRQCKRCMRATSVKRTRRDVREWARLNGFEVSDRGRLPKAIVAAYDKAAAA
jgi:hypothetical protein